ncbi:MULTISPECIES: hypothetical protein [Luteibacter]|uniref:hypothetical protein n=1 Tax=Luteibacter TaxID=242605 RepID=UPI0009DD0605|nr:MULTISPECIES: hypothetical protein [unclassified Luteibacter]
MQRSRVRPDAFSQTHVRRGASIESEATILPGIEIGERATVGAGAVVTHDVPARGIVMRSLARITGYAA